MPRSIVLMGLRGSGKSTVGPMLASKLSYDFQDLDDAVLSDSSHKTIADIVRAEGWEGFRNREREQLEIWLWALDTLPEKRLVLALGGGAPTHDPSRALLQSAQLHDFVALVYLRAQPETLAKRMAASADRPSLTGKDPLEEIRDIFNQRDELYRSIADVVLDIDTLDEQATAQAIESALMNL